jgi:dolichol-phosphate mannosyltransferase
MKTLSIVIPAFNEEKFIGELLTIIDQVGVEQLGFQKEIIVVDDGSTDKTFQIASSFPAAKVIRQDNAGKGAAVQNGVRNSSGDFILIQDADLEYSPFDYLKMLEILGSNERLSVYGSRYLNGESIGMGIFKRVSKKQTLGPWIANISLTIWTFILYGFWITDTLTAYKIYPSKIIKSFVIRTSGFESDHELTAKLIKEGIQIIEVPISYEPRTQEEGKKIRPIDGLIAIWTLLRFRFTS